jgi:hypothetical protein
MSNGTKRQSIFLLQRMLFAANAMSVKLLLQEMIYGAVECKWETGHTFRPELIVQIETPRTFLEQINL